MYISTYIRIWIHIRTGEQLHIHRHACINWPTHIDINIHAYTCLHTHRHACMHASMHTCKRTCMHVYIHTYVRTFMHTYRTKTICHYRSSDGKSYIHALAFTQMFCLFDSLRTGPMVSVYGFGSWDRVILSMIVACYPQPRAMGASSSGRGCTDFMAYMGLEFRV